MKAVVASLVLLAMSGVARGAGPILLESYVGAPPEDGRFFVDYLVRSMGSDAPMHGAPLRQAIESSLSRSAGTPEPIQGVRSVVEDGRRLFIEGQFTDAVAQLERAREQLMGKVALVASDQTLRDALYKALLVLADSYLRVNQPDRATEMVSQAIRSFPDRDLSMVRYGPELVTFYKKVRREMDRQQRGMLTITTRPDKCLVFVNERFVGLSPARVVDLYPGRYRIYVQRPQEPGRAHLANINGEDHQLTIDFALDRVLRSETFAGLQFASNADRERRESAFAAAVARALESPMAVVIGFRRHQGRRMMEGTAVSADTGRVIRAGMVALEPAAPAPDTLKALGMFLVSGKAGSGVIVSAGGPVGAPVDAGRRDDGPAFFSARVFKWVTLGVAVAGLASGITLMALDGRGTCDAPEGGLCPDSYNTMAPGIALTAVGGAAAVGSGLLFWWDARSGGKSRSRAEQDTARRPKRIAAVLPWIGRRQVGLGATWTF